MPLEACRSTRRDSRTLVQHPPISAHVRYLASVVGPPILLTGYALPVIRVPDVGTRPSGLWLRRCRAWRRRTSQKVPPADPVQEARLPSGIRLLACHSDPVYHADDPNERTAATVAASTARDHRCAQHKDEGTCCGAECGDYEAEADKPPHRVNPHESVHHRVGGH